MLNYSARTKEKIRQALISDPSFDFICTGDNLRRGICPSCGERECFIKLRNPKRVLCARFINCQWGESTRILYPEIFSPLKKDTLADYPDNNINTSETQNAI